MNDLAYGLPRVSVHASQGSQNIVRLLDEFVDIRGVRSKDKVGLPTNAIFGQRVVIAGRKLEALEELLDRRYEGFIELLRA